MLNDVMDNLLAWSLWLVQSTQVGRQLCLDPVLQQDMMILSQMGMHCVLNRLPED